MDAGCALFSTSLSRELQPATSNKTGHATRAGRKRQGGKGSESEISAPN